MLLRWLVVVALQAAAKPGNANLPSGNHDDGNGEKQYAEHFLNGQADERPRRRGIVAPIPVLNGKGAGVGLRKRLLRIFIAVWIIIFKHYALPLDAADISGIPFLDYRCTPDTNLIIYGHNMKNGTMFSDLKKYLDKSFREQHPVIELETADGVRYFTVTEVIKTDIYDKRYEDIEVKDGRQKLILSTCYGSEKSGRLLVIAEET